MSTTFDEANAIMSKNPAALALLLRDCADAFTAALQGHPALASFQARHQEFLRSLQDKSTAEQYALAQEHLSALGQVLMEREKVKFAAAQELRERKERMRQEAAERASRSAFAAAATAGFLPALQVLQHDLAALGCETHWVGDHQALKAFSDKFDAVVKRVRDLIGEALARTAALADKKAA